MATETFTCSVCDNNLPHTDLAEFKKTKLFCNICDLLYCSVCNLVQKDERSFSNKQLVKSRENRKCKGCVEIIEKTKKKRVRKKKFKKKRVKKRKFSKKKLFIDYKDDGQRHPKCPYCMKHSLPTKPKFHPPGRYKLHNNVSFGGDNPSVRWLLGKGYGKGGSMCQCGCSASRRDLEVLVSSLENAYHFYFENYGDLVQLHEEWKTLTGHEDSKGNLVGDPQFLLHFRNQEFIPKHVNLPQNLATALLHIQMGIVGNFVSGDDELLKEFDNKLLEYKIPIPENKEYFDMEKKLKKNENSISKLSQQIRDHEKEIKITVLKKDKNKIMSIVKKIEKEIKNLKSENKQILKNMKSFLGYYMQKKQEAFKNSKIILSQGKQNTYTGGMARKVLYTKPHIFLFLPNSFDIPNSTKKLTLGSYELYSDTLQLYEKTRLLFSVLWSTDSLCIHLLKFAKLRLESFWRARCKRFPYKVPTWKEHYLICHTFPRLLEKRSLGREGEMQCEHNMQNINKVSKRVKTIHNAKKRMELKLKYSNLKSKEKTREVIGGRKKCPQCNKFKNKRWANHCKCFKTKL